MGLLSEVGLVWERFQTWFMVYKHLSNCILQFEIFIHELFVWNVFAKHMYWKKNQKFIFSVFNFFLDTLRECQLGETNVSNPANKTLQFISLRNNSFTKFQTTVLLRRKIKTQARKLLIEKKISYKNLTTYASNKNLNLNNLSH